MIVIWIVIYWAIGLFTAIFASTTLAGILSTIIVLASVPGRPENTKFVVGHLLTTIIFGLLVWLGIFLWQWLTGRFPSSGSVGFWIGIALGSLGSLKIIPFLTHAALQQVLPRSQ